MFSSYILKRRNFFEIVNRRECCYSYTINYTKSMFYIVKGIDFLYIKYEYVTGYVEPLCFYIHSYTLASIYIFVFLLIIYHLYAYT